jgi:hypothetical protein
MSNAGVKKTIEERDAAARERMKVREQRNRALRRAAIAEEEALRREQADLRAAFYQRQGKRGGAA